jgi:hypothetical protein
MRLALTLVGACALGACAGSPAAPLDGAAPDDGACSVAPPNADAAIEVGAPPDGPAAFCGGVIALAGVTPFGPFAPNALSTEIVPPPQAALRITLAQDPPSGTELTFDIAADATGAFDGPHDVAGFIERGGTVRPVMVHVEVMGAPAADAGAAAGQTRLDLTVTTDCGSFSGSLAAPTCGAAA